MGRVLNTALFCAVAAGLVGAAIWLKPGGVTDAVYSDQGEDFFPEFKDIASAKEIEIRTMDRLTGAVRILEMKHADKGWVLSSHENYPADMLRSVERLASFIGRTKEVVASDAPGSHAEYGVLDPQDAKSAGKDGVGRRYTFKTSGREVLADFIIGKPVPKREGYCYVRVPNRDRVYETQIDLTLTYPPGANNWLDTDFSDWVYIDPLMFSQQQIKKITLNRYDIKEERRGWAENVDLVGREEIEILQTKDSDGKSAWSIADVNPATETINEDAVKAIAKAIDEFTIEGATRKHELLTQWYKEGKVPKIPTKAKELAPIKGSNQMGQRLIWLPAANGATTGFLLEEGGPRLLSNLGEIIMELDSGLRYVMRIGELSGSLAEQAAGGESSEEGVTPVTTSGKPLRYMLVDVEYDDALMPEPMPPVKPQILIEDEERKRVAEEAKKAADSAPREDTPADPNAPQDQGETDQETPAAPDSPFPPPVVDTTADDAAAQAKQAWDENVAKATNEYSQALSKFTSDRDKWNKDKQSNLKRLGELQERYRDWVFLFPEEQVGKTQKSRADLVKPKQ